MRRFRFWLGVRLLRPWLLRDEFEATIMVRENVEPTKYWMGRLTAVQRLQKRGF